MLYYALCQDGKTIEMLILVFDCNAIVPSRSYCGYMSPNRRALCDSIVIAARNEKELPIIGMSIDCVSTIACDIVSCMPRII